MNLADAIPDPALVFMALNMVMLLGWYLTLRRYKQTVHAYAVASYWWRWWTVQAVKNDTLPPDDERFAAEELGPSAPDIESQIQGARDALEDDVYTSYWVDSDEE